MSDQNGTLLRKVEEYEQRLAKDPRSKIFVSLAEAYRRLGRLDDALDTINRGMTAHPDLPEAQIAAGRILAQRGDHAGALSLFKAVAPGHPGYDLALKGTARVYLLMNRVQEAFPVIKQLLQLYPEDPEVEKLKASCQAKFANTMKNEAQKSDSPIKTATLADIYVKQGLLNEAIQVYEEILAANPDNPEIRQRLAKVKARLEPGEETVAAEEPVDSETSAQLEVMTEGSAPPASLSAADTLLPVFETWLQAIRQRREHVR